MIGIAPIRCSLFDILSCSIRDNKHLRLTHCMSVSFTSDTDKVSAGLTCINRCQLNNKGLMLNSPTHKMCARDKARKWDAYISHNYTHERGVKQVKFSFTPYIRKAVRRAYKDTLRT